MEKRAWAFVGMVVIGLSSCTRLPKTTAPEPITPTPAATLELAPPKREENSLPRKIDIELTLTNPQDLKVKPGTEITAGQILSDRADERRRLLARKQQLELSLKKLNLPLSQPTPPAPISEIKQLPPISYAQEEANIKLKQQELEKANQALAVQQEKIAQLQAMKDEPGKDEQLQLILQHQQTKLEQLATALERAQIQLEIAQAHLTAAQEQRAYQEYQQQLEISRRAQLVAQQQLAWQQQEAETQRQLQLREYQKAQIQAQIQEINDAIIQLSQVRAPYPGTIKKIKWTGQSNHTLTVELTLAVASQQPAVTSQAP